MRLSCWFNHLMGVVVGRKSSWRRCAGEIGLIVIQSMLLTGKKVETFTGEQGDQGAACAFEPADPNPS